MNSEIKNFPIIELSFDHYQTTSEMIKELKDRVSSDLVISSVVRDIPIEDFFTSFREGIFSGDPKYHAYVHSVDPRESKVIEDETYYQFTKRVKKDYDLKTLPANAVPALLVNFSPSYYNRPCMVTFLFQIKIHNSWMHCAFVLESDEEGLPIIKFIGLNPESKLNMDYDYLFLV